MRKYLLFLLLGGALFFGDAKAQTNLDSLKRVWENTALPDTQRLSGLYELILYGYLNPKPDSALILATSYHDFAKKRGINKEVVNGLMLKGYAFTVKGDMDQGLVYFRESIDLCKKYKLKGREAVASDLMGQTLGWQGKYDEAIAYLERSLKLNLELGNKDGIASSYINLAIQFTGRNQYEKGLPYLQKALELKMEMGDSLGVAICLNNIGSSLQQLGRVPEAKALFFRAMHTDTSAANYGNINSSLNYLSGISIEEGKFEEALDYAEKCRDLSQKIGDVWTEAGSWNLVGSVHTRQGLYVQGIEDLNRAIKLYESINNEAGVANVLGNIANIQLDQKAYTEALATYEKAKKVFEKMDQKDAMAQVNSSIGNVYRRLLQPEKALRHYETSLAIAREVQSPALTSYALARMADLYFDQSDLAQAHRYILESLKLSDNPNDQLNHSANLALAGRIFQKEGNHTQAIAFARKGYDIALKTGAISNLSSASEVLYLAYKATGQSAKALEMHENYITYRDSMINEENTRAIFQQQMRYEYEKKEAATRAEQEKKDALARAELSRRNLQRNASLGGLGLVAALAGVLFVNGRRRRRTNELLTAQKAEIEVKSNQNELLLKEIHHRVKNNLQMVSSLLHLQSAHITDEDVRLAVSEGQHRVESMALIHQKLYQRDNLAAIEMRDYLQNLVQSLIDTFEADPDRIRFDLNMPELELDVDTAVPLGLIVNELITNSLKYAFPDGREGTITVSLQKAGTGLELFVGDDGVGKANTATGTSFGSQLVLLLSAQLGGKISQETTAGYATRLTIKQTQE